jgi:hypothetical protein
MGQQVSQQVSLALHESMHRALVKLASFLPGLLALLLAVVVLTIIGALLAYTLRRILTALRFDERFAANQAPNVADWSPRHSPTVLVARAAFWACVLVGLLIGVSAFDASFAGNSQVSDAIIPYLTHWAGAVLILIAGTVIARFLARSVLIGAVNLQLQYARLLSLGVKWLVLVLAAAMALDHIEIGGTIVDLAFGVLFGGIVLTLSLAIGLGSRELVSRSLERSTDAGPIAVRPSAYAAEAESESEAQTEPRPRPTGTLRHF